MDDDSIPHDDLRIQDHIRIHGALITQPAIGGNHHAGVDIAARTDDNVFANVGTGIDIAIRTNDRRWRDNGQRRNSHRGAFSLGTRQDQGLNKGTHRILDHNPVAVRIILLRVFQKLGRNQNRCGACRFQQPQVEFVDGKRNIARFCLGNRLRVPDQHSLVAVDCPTHAAREFPDRDLHARSPFRVQLIESMNLRRKPSTGFLSEPQGAGQPRFGAGRGLTNDEIRMTKE